MRVKLVIFLAVTTHCIFAQEMPEIVKHLDGITVYDVAGDGKNIWAATNGDGVYNYSKSKKKWSNYSTSNRKLQMDFFYSIDANEKYVWAGSTDGLFILDKKRNRWTKRKFAVGGQLSNWIRSIKYDKDDDVVWIGRFKYLTKFDIKKRRFYDYDLTINDDQKTNTIKVIELDGDSLVWFGTENGLHKYDKSRGITDGGTVQYYNNRLNYFNGEGEAISISGLLFEQNFVWIGLDEFKTRINPDYNVGGLYRYDRRNEWLRFDEHHGFRGNGIFDIERTGNYLWASCYQFGSETKDIYGRGVALVNIISGDIILLDNEQIPDTVLKMYFDGTSMWMASIDGLYQIDLTNQFVNGFYKLIGASMIEFSENRILEIKSQFAGKKIAVIGDLMLDGYFWGDVSRISPEAPVPIVEIDKEFFRFGGAANVATNIEHLKGTAIPIGVVGKDNDGQIIRTLLKDQNIIDNGIIEDPDRPTTVKVRVIADNQHVVRIDRESKEYINKSIETELIDKFTEHVKNLDAVILQDYNKGVLTENVITNIISIARDHDIIISVDPKFNNFYNYKNVTVFKPNKKESEDILGIKLNDDKKITEAGIKFIEELNAEYLLITLGEKGISLFDRNHREKRLATKARKVADVSGAGDTVISTLTMSLSAGADITEAAYLANYAGGLVCEEIGIVPINHDNLFDHLLNEIR